MARLFALLLSLWMLCLSGAVQPAGAQGQHIDATLERWRWSHDFSFEEGATETKLEDAVRTSGVGKEIENAIRGFNDGVINRLGKLAKLQMACDASGFDREKQSFLRYLNNIKADVDTVYGPKTSEAKFVTDTIGEVSATKYNNKCRATNDIIRHVQESENTYSTAGIPGSDVGQLTPSNFVVGIGDRMGLYMAQLACDEYRFNYLIGQILSPYATRLSDAESALLSARQELQNLTAKTQSETITEWEKDRRAELFNTLLPAFVKTKDDAQAEYDKVDAHLKKYFKFKPCKKVAQTGHSCPPGFIHIPGTETCIKKPVSQTQPSSGNSCPPGFFYIPGTDTCFKQPPETPPQYNAPVFQGVQPDAQTPDVPDFDPSGNSSAYNFYIPGCGPIDPCYACDEGDGPCEAPLVRITPFAQYTGGWDSGFLAGENGGGVGIVNPVATFDDGMTMAGARLDGLFALGGPTMLELFGSLARGTDSLAIYNVSSGRNILALPFADPNPANRGVSINDPNATATLMNDRELTHSQVGGTLWLTTFPVGRVGVGGAFSNLDSEENVIIDVNSAGLDVIGNVNNSADTNCGRIFASAQIRTPLGSNAQFRARVDGGVTACETEYEHRASVTNFGANVASGSGNFKESENVFYGRFQGFLDLNLNNILGAPGVFTLHGGVVTGETLLPSLQHNVGNPAPAIPGFLDLQNNVMYTFGATLTVPLGGGG